MVERPLSLSERLAAGYAAAVAARDKLLQSQELQTPCRPQEIGRSSSPSSPLVCEPNEASPRTHKNPASNSRLSTSKASDQRQHLASRSKPQFADLGQEHLASRLSNHRRSSASEDPITTHEPLNLALQDSIGPTSSCQAVSRPTNPSDAPLPVKRKRRLQSREGKDSDEERLPSTSARSKRTKPEWDKMDIVDVRMTPYTSEWYSSIPTGARKPTYRRAYQIEVRSIVALVRKLRSWPQAGGEAGIPLTILDKESLQAELRDTIHHAEFWFFMEPTLLKDSKVVEENGLPAIFTNEDGLFPSDIQEDAAALYKRWMAGNLDPELLRGLVVKRRQNTSTGKENIARSFDKQYQFAVPCNYVGAGELVNGQWWPLQLCAIRDGAHGETEAGIHGSPAHGAHSIVLSGGSAPGGKAYEDNDMGDTIEYCGTAGKEGKATARTQYMLKSMKTKNPIRVLRSHKLAESNPHRPAMGLRYDGLYQITGCKLLDKDTQMHQFVLRRCPGQNPIRSSGPGARPTALEQERYKEIRKLQGFEG